MQLKHIANRHNLVGDNAIPAHDSANMCSSNKIDIPATENGLAMACADEDEKIDIPATKNPFDYIDT